MAKFTVPNKMQLADLPKRYRVTIDFTIATTADDSIADLAHGLSGDVLNASVVTHRVGCRIDNVKAAGKSIYQWRVKRDGECTRKLWLRK